MRRLTTCLAAAFTLLVGTATGETKITTADEYAKAMKAIGGLGAAMNKALVVEVSYPEARKLLGQVRDNYVALQGFWTERKRDDAVSIVKSGLTQIDAMDKLIEMDADLLSVQKASEEFGKTTCAACHNLYREGDRQTGFRFKPGVF